MKIAPSRKWLSLVCASAVSAVLIATTGCEKAEKGPTAVGATTPAPVPEGTAIPSAEPTSFSEVGRHLDTGGSFYLFLSTEKALSGLQDKADLLRDVALASIPPDETEKKAGAEQVADFLQSLLRESGIETLTGFGASSIAIEPDLYLNKFFAYHPVGKGRGFLWNIVGEKAHPLDALDLLPKDTAVGSFADVDFHALFQFIQQIAANSGQPEATQAIARASAQVKMVTGMSLEELTESIGKEWGFIVTLNPEREISFPIEGEPQSFPAPRGALLLRVTDDKVFNQIDRILEKNPQVEKTDEEELQMRVLPMPMMPELELRPTAAQWNGWLIVSSHESLVHDIVAANKGGGLRTTAQFKKLSDRLPTEGNSFSIATEQFANAIQKFQKSSIRKDASISPEQMKLLEPILDWQKPTISYSVTSRLDDGVLVVNKSTAGASQFLAPLVVVPAAIAAGVAVPVYAEVQKKAKATKSLNNAKQIAVACTMYAADHEGAFPKELKELVGPYIADGTILISPFNESEPGYAYTSGLNDSAEPDAVLLKDKFSSESGYEIIVFVDGRGEIRKK